MLIFTAVFLISQFTISIARINILENGVKPLIKNSAAIIFFIDLENESYLQPYTISTRKEKCCLNVDVDQKDCDSAEMVGGSWFVQPKERTTLILVYPTVYQHDKVGSCSFHFISKCGDAPGYTTRRMEIPFDTRVFGRTLRTRKHALFKDYDSIQRARRCLSPDDDTLNECAPVNCDIKYNGNRSFFDRRVRRCVSARPCFRDMKKNTPDIAYIPSGNVCRDLGKPLTMEELYLLSVGENTVDPVAVSKRSSDYSVEDIPNSISECLKHYMDLIKRKENSREMKIAVLAVSVFIFTACWQLSLCVLAMFLVLKLKEVWVTGLIQEKTSAAVYHFKMFLKRDEKGNKGEVKSLLLDGDNEIETESRMKESAADLLERISREVSSSRRYRIEDVGSQISLSGTKSHDAR